jgi:hypothetical protein
MGLGSRIRDPEKTYSGSWIQRSKRHRIPDPDKQHWKEFSMNCFRYRYLLESGLLGIDEIAEKQQVV